jgi:hypothetical protein
MKPEGIPLETAQRSSKKRVWIGRLAKLLVIGLLMSLSFAAGVAVTLRMVLPIAMSFGLVGIASAGANQMMIALFSGTSQERLQVLATLSEHFNGPNAPATDMSSWKFIEPGLKACLSDPDPAVVELAKQLIEKMSSPEIK